MKSSVSDGGMVFEFDGDDFAAASEQVDTAPAAKPEPEPAKEEFSIPQVFAPDERYDTPPTEDISSKIRTPYVPRFTDASKNYRMKDDPRPRRAEPVRQSAPKVEVKDTADSQQTSPEVELDPTAEIVSVTKGVIVEMANPQKEENTETLNIYKFADPDKAENEPTRDTDEEERKLRRILFPDEEKEISAPDSEVDDALDDESEPDGLSNDESPCDGDEPSVPDPDGEDISVVDFSGGAKKKIEQIDPDGVSEDGGRPKGGYSEFTHRTQRDGFKDRFLDRLMSLRIRFCAAMLFLLCLVAYESLRAFGVISVGVLEGVEFSGALALFDLILCIAVCVFSIPEVVRSIAALFKGRATPELVLPVAFIINLAYLLVCSTGAYAEYQLYGSLLGVLSVCTILSTYHKVNADFAAFKMISQNKEKRILDRKMTRELPEENMALDGLIDEYKSRTVRIFRSGFVTDFFKRTALSAEQPRQTVIILSVCFGVSLVLGGVSFFVAEGLLSMLSSMTLGFLLGAPAVSLMSHKLSYSRAQKAVVEEDSAVVGESALLDFSEIDVIAFEDNEIFGPDDVNLKRFMLYGDSDNMEQAMRQMCSLFGVIGGPLHYIFSNSLDHRMRITPASDPIIEEDGLSGDVGGKRISAGSEEYMRRHGIAIPEGAVRAEGGIDTTKIMYAAEDGEVFAKFYVRYSFSEEFTMLIPTLKAEKIVPLIYTADPNVSHELCKMLSAGSDCMRVMKRLAPVCDDEKIYGRISAGMVTYGDKINAIDVLLLTKKYRRYLSAVSKAELYVMGAGLGCAAALALFVPSFWTASLVLWQGGVCAALGAALRFIFGKKKDD